MIRLDGMGDLVITTPFLRELRRSAPEAHITVVVRTPWLDVVKDCPHVDAVLTFEPGWDLAYRKQKNLWRAWRWSLRHLRPLQWEAVLVPQAHFSLFDARWLAWFSGASHRLGRREIGAGPEDGWDFLTEVHRMENRGHDALNCLRWLEQIGGAVVSDRLEVVVSDEARARIAEKCPNLGYSGALVAVGIGASQKEKIWPVDRYVEVARRLRRAGARLVLVGAADCTEAARVLVAAIGDGVVDMTGRLSLGETAALLERCSLYVGNDSGPMHLSAAVEAGIVEVTGWPSDVPETVPGTPKRIGPWTDRIRIVQPRSSIRGTRICVEAVTVDQVWEAIHSLAAELPGSGLQFR